MLIDVRILEVCVLLSASVFGFALWRAWRERHAFSRFVTTLLAGICISSCFLFFPPYLDQSYGLIQEKGYAGPAVIRAAAYTLFYSLKAIGGGQEIDMMELLTVSGAHPVIRFLFFGLNYGFFVAAPLLTSGLVLSLFGDLADQISYRLCRKRRHHVFSELNSNALCLARKLRGKYPGERIVFCNTKDAEKDLRAEAKRMGAVMLHGSCTSKKLCAKKKQLQFYLVCADEDTNLCLAEALICRYRDRTEESCIINAFVRSGTGIRMIENMDRGGIGVRFVDATALLCSDLLLQHPLYRMSDGADTVSVAIVGGGKLGMRLLKTVTWCGVIESRALKIRVYDQNAAVLAQELEAQCPELTEYCDVKFVAADARTSALEKRVLDPDRGSADATYIVVAMGDDDLNIEVAERLSRLFRHRNKCGQMPRILARVRDTAKAEVCVERENPYLRQMNIYPFGGDGDVFADGILHHSYLENLAFAVDLCYRKLLPEEDPMTMTEQQLREYFAREDVQKARNRFMQSEYNRRSSMAAALHIPVKLYSCGILPGDRRIPTAEHARLLRARLQNEPDLLERLAKMEHERWSRFMRSEGYVQASWEDLEYFYPVLEKKDNQDLLGKRHLCLTDWDALDDLNEKYDRLGPPEPKNFTESDFDQIRGIPRMLLLAKRMEEVLPEDLA